MKTNGEQITSRDLNGRRKRELSGNGHEQAQSRHFLERRRPRTWRPTLVTGGAGFIGTNVASRLLSTGHRVLIFDNLSRPGVARNLQWLVDTFGDAVDVIVGDIRDERAVAQAVARADRVFHLAAQVAVTTSLEDPVTDFEINARGTLNILEAIRRQSSPPPLLFTSTNKVYGNLSGLELSCNDTRYEPTDRNVRATGVGESQALDFHSPYGCSKGVADQYVLDYARSYGLPAVVFRMSCIYGPHQCGTEDQGWVAHFLLRALDGEPITLYGDGKQVRDTLYVEDLVDAMLAALEHIEETSGQAFNIGGGVDNTCSLLELVDLIAQIHGQIPELRCSDWRQGDQRYYVSDTTSFQSVTGWSPRVSVAAGVRRLYDWVFAARRSRSSRSVVQQEVQHEAV